jgi:hypothetical protein
MSQFRRIEKTASFLNEAMSLSIDSRLIDGFVSLLSRCSIGKMVHKFDFIPWTKQPAGIFIFPIQRIEDTRLGVTYLNFGEGKPAFLLSIKQYSQPIRELIEQVEIAQLDKLAACIYSELVRAKA